MNKELNVQDNSKISLELIKNLKYILQRIIDSKYAEMSINQLWIMKDN